ncbi:zinc-binding alcohol dehydrogenase family protein [Cytophagaceae bacterium DM2B3-1]|uniref:Zinc-binding alcohol dehydrogenase family protein n=1 Tax=Xanthocytophaga flava TaxID=3048013 RepID=A0ABT7CMU2_9BACT|nr:zinc-binding alcohol dehydrogenase family protein [Xanthocytophaga flavus]MDJ1495075.1 zinc-binding alcohol dehydrogenase family protein [Xanthocytophaga flavus]
MKAAVIFSQSGIPQYTENFSEPITTSDEQAIILVKAAAIKNLDKAKASGRHYSTEGEKSQAIIPGGDGVGLLADGTRVYALGVTGMLAEKAVVEKNRMIKLPNGIDNATAAALPNAVAGSAMALRFSARMNGGEIILINGATGVTGKLAIQIAKLYGAGKIIVTGRNESALQALQALGADEYLLTTHDETFVKQLKKIHQQTPIDIVVDYLWGRTAELILETLKGTGAFTHRTRFVSVGSMTGDTIQLSSQILRSVNLQLSGSGLGSWTKEEMQLLLTEIIPEMFQLAADNKLKVDTMSIPLKEIEQVWYTDISSGTRLVVEI